MTEETMQTGLSDNAAAALAYLTVLPAIIFLVVAPYNKTAFVRFHAWQSIFFHIAIVLSCIAMSIILMICAVIPVIGWIAGILGTIVFILYGLCILVLLIVTMVKASKGERFRIPVICGIADKMVGA